TLFGGDGNDLLHGMNQSTDYLNGGDGDDALFAGHSDILTGGDGQDSFYLSDWQSGSDNSITIMDFNASEDQLIFMMDGEDS
ncbi:hypothetical protein Q8W27_17085, partial [Oceanobacter sp. 2_MG-2023]|nr:hypothetical protein [Oceanobacter sp. 2_MG-2023]